MRDVELFQMALGLESPWYVERTEFDAEGRRLDLYLDFRRGGRFTCPECGVGGCPAYDTTAKSSQHLNFFPHEAYLHARIPRVQCEACGVKLVEVHNGNPDGIWEVCVDMSPVYRKGLREHLPQARITFDRFHVLKLMNEAVDQVRRAERGEAPELERTRYLWLKNTSSLSPSQPRHLDQLLLGQTHLRTVKAYQLKLAFQDFWELPRADAPRFLEAWCSWVRTSGLEPMVRFAQTVERHRAGILRRFQTRISNGLLEGLSSLVQATKARARGYRSTRNLIAMIYLMHGRLPLHQPILNSEEPNALGVPPHSRQARLV